LTRAKTINCFGKKRIFFGDNFVIQSWIHTTETPNDSPAQREMRFSGSLRVSLCGSFDFSSNYQTKPGGLDRAEKKI